MRRILLLAAFAAASLIAGCGSANAPGGPIDYSVADVICQDGTINVLADPNNAADLCPGGVRTIDYRYHKHQ